MKPIHWILKKRFFLLVLSIFLLTFSISYFIRSTLIQVFTEANHSFKKENLPRKKSVKFEKEFLSKSSLSLENIDELVEGNLIRGSAVSLMPGELSIEPPFTSPPDSKFMSVQVTGTVSGNQSFARVVLKEKDKEEAEEYKVGQKLGNYKILRINPHSITLGGENFSFNVEIGETIGEAYELRKPKGLELEPIKDKKEAAIEHKPTTISKTDVERILKNPTSIYEKARFAPNLVNGAIDGIKIYEVLPSHIFYQLGARGGDIIKRVNGMPLGETVKMLEIWSAIKVSPKIQVDLDRKGQVHTFTFLVRN